MKKILFGVLLGALVYFAAGMLAWMVFPWHDSVIKKLPEETLIRDTLKVVVKEPGFYYFPSDKTENGRMDPKEFREHFKKGPTGVLMYSLGGREPMDSKNIVVGVLEALVTAGFSLWFLILSRRVLPGYMGRVLAVTSLGIFVWFNSHIPYWNWFFFPKRYLLVVLLDNVFCFGLMSLVLAKFAPEEK